MTTTDYYSLLETAVKNYVQTRLPDRFTEPDKQISKSDDTIVTKGFKSFFMMYPGNAPIPYEGARSLGEETIEVTFEILVDAWSRWEGSEAQAWASFKAYRADIFHIFNVLKKGRTINRTAGVKGAFLTITERPRYIPLMAGAKDSVASHIAQVMSLYIPRVINKE